MICPAPDFTAIKRRFYEKQLERHEALEHIFDALNAGHPPVSLCRSAADIAHTIAGTAGTIGHAGLGDAAFALETALRTGLNADRHDRTTAARDLNGFLEISAAFCLQNAPANLR